MGTQTKKIMQSISSEEMDGKPRTIIHEILESNSLPPSEKDSFRVSAEVDTITAAGLETTAQIIRFTIYHIYTNLSLLHRLRIELRDAVCSHPADTIELSNYLIPSLSQLEHLPYLTAAILEGLRLSPGTATRSARIAPDRDIVYNDKYVIPKGTPTGMTTLLMQRDERVYEGAEWFSPERWVEEGSDGKVRVRRNEKAFAPFGRGTRMCLGMQWVCSLPSRPFASFMSK